MKMQANFENTTIFTEKKQLINYLKIIERYSSGYILKTLIPLLPAAAAVFLFAAESSLAWLFAALFAAAVIYRFIEIRIKFSKKFGRSGETAIGNPQSVKVFDTYIEQTCTVTVRRIEYDKIKMVIVLYDCVIIFYKDIVLCIADSGYSKGNGKAFKQFLAEKIDSTDAGTEFKISDASIFDIG